jgi:putative SOS response-associated peptidase YedK
MTAWLGDAADPSDLLKPYPSEPMHKREVGLRVNNVRNDDPGLLEPAPEEGDTLF